MGQVKMAGIQNKFFLFIFTAALNDKINEHSVLLI